MSEALASVVEEICEACGNERSRMMDIVEAVQAKFGQVSDEAMGLIAQATGAHRVEVAGVVSFYAFLTDEPVGEIVIRVCDDVIDEMKGSKAVMAAFAAELGIGFGETTADGKITLVKTPCIGMCDQAPAIMVNDEIITYLGADHARQIARHLKAGGEVKKLASRLGDGNNAHDLVRTVVHNNVRLPGEVLFGDYEPGEGLAASLNMSPAEVIRNVKTSRLRGRGGAGFPTGMKWEFTRAAVGEKKYVLCNADEGEPGTFKDRVLLTENADMMLEGMTIGGYAIGADEGVIYLRGEYAYLRAYLESVIATRRDAGLLGKNICGKAGFDFDVRIQMGAGAYICGEETALISSCEGLRGDPKNRPPFPAQKGYLGKPTTVNNVETFCKVTRILEKGAPWFAHLGTDGSTGTKLLSISGDCAKPGIYEIPFGITIAEILTMCDAEDTQAIQVGGPSGQLLGPASFDKTISYDDVATGGSFMVFNSRRDILKIVRKFTEFFEEETCGYCTPCRVGCTLLGEFLDKFLAGKAETGDMDKLRELGDTIKFASRCGLGQTASHPVLSSLTNFPAAYEAKTAPAPDTAFQPTFDIRAALAPAEEIAGRESVYYGS